MQPTLAKDLVTTPKMIRKASIIRNLYNVRCLRVATRLFSGASPSFHMKLTSTSPDEISHFNALASSWWDVNGPQRILHKMNMLRMDFISSTVQKHVQLNKKGTPIEEEVYIPPYSLDLLPKPIRSRIVEDQEIRRQEILTKSKVRVLDVGCGGGILAESMARLNFVASVLGIDLSGDVLEAAKLHKAKDPTFNDTNLNYSLCAIEELPEGEKYDIVTMFEMLEHVDYPAKVLLEAMKRVEDDGWIFISTINRDFVSWFTTIFLGEHVLGIVPTGTHTLDKYINQLEIREWLEENGADFEIVDAKGCLYIPAYGWEFTNSPDVGNYFMAIRKISSTQ